MANQVENLLVEAKKLSDGDLACLMANLNKYQIDREQAQKKQDWEAVRSTISAYISTWGDIQVYDDEHTLQIDKYSDFSNIGQIDVEIY